MSTKNRQIILARRPQGMPAKEDFQIQTSIVSKPEEGQVLIRTLYLSVDPYMRGRMRAGKSYVNPFPLNEVITGGAVGEIVESRHSGFSPGDVVVGHLGWQDYSNADGESLQKVNPALAPISTALGVLGMPGLTAYFGMMDIGNPQPGKSVVVSGAAGAVGSIAGQIAKLHGCRVVGITGSDAKTDYIHNDLGFDVAINYKTTDHMEDALQKACPDGIDVYFDNVGGETTDAVMNLLNYQARIVLCGQISQYNHEQPEMGPRNLSQLVKKSALMKGFIVGDYASRNQEGMDKLTEWVVQGKVKYRENVVKGLEQTPRAFQGLFTGENIGKQLVKVADDHG